MIADLPQLKPNLWAHHSVELYSDGSWWVVVGLQRAAMEMERMLGMPPKLAELPPGEDL
jgi:hypothetical protein